VCPICRSEKHLYTSAFYVGKATDGHGAQWPQVCVQEARQTLVQWNRLYSCMYFTQFLCESSCQVQAVFLHMLENYTCFNIVYIASASLLQLNEDILTFFISEVSLSASQTSWLSLLIASRNVTETQDL
jgi:hypothetical protein